MKTLKNKVQNLCAIIENQTVYITNVSFSKIYKQFGVSTFNLDGWSTVDNPTEKRFKGLKTRFKHEQENKKAIDKKQAERIERSEKTTVKSWIDQRLQSKLKNKLENLAAGLPDMGYSMGAKYEIELLKTFKGIYSNCQTYSKSCKYRPTHGYFELKISLDEFKNSENIGGVFTYIYPNQKRKVKKCWWYERAGEKQYYSIVKVEGYIYKGYHSKSKEQAKKTGDLLEKTAKEQAKKAKQQAKNRIESFKKEYSRALRFQYSYSDSLICGNCEIGTKAFILRCKLDKTKKYRGSFLLKVAHEKSTHSVSYVERMIRHKAKNI